MRDDPVVDLADCTEFRQALQARPPRVVHGTALLLVALLAAGLTWAALTEGDLVIRASGSVRPVTAPQKVVLPIRDEVAEVFFEEGDVVEWPGKELLRLDTRRLQWEIEEQDATIQAKRHELESLDPARPALIQQKKHEIAAALARRGRLQLQHDRATVRAPIAGVITKRDAKVGEFLDAGKVVAEIAPREGFHFEVEVSSADMEELRVGLPARVKLDAYDYQDYGTLDGKVVSISPDSEVREGRTTFLVKIQLEANEVRRGTVRRPVKLGMAGQADLVTGRKSLLTLLVQKIRRTVSLG